MNVRNVTVIGASGTMGANVAGIFASFGAARVYCIGRDIERVRRKIPAIVQSVRADAISANLVPADFSMLEECIRNSDLVFESATEDIHVKCSIARRVSSVLQPHAVSCTGSSGLSVTGIASCYREEQRGRFYGVHLFNPPYSMTLCELVSTPFADPLIREQLKQYLRTVLFRTVVEVKDSPAFLGNRIGFQFINEALQYADRYRDNGGIDYIDAILGTFTGRAMPPLMTSDFVGLDVHKAIVENLYDHTADYAHETFLLPAFCRQLISEGKLGRKSSGGLYKNVKQANERGRQMVYDIGAGAYRDVIPYAFPFAKRMKDRIAEGDYAKAFDTLMRNTSLEAEICLSFLLKYILYSFTAAREAGCAASAADDVMAAGYNWCPPLALYQALSQVTHVPSLLRERLPDVCSRIDTDRVLDHVMPSVYDYRIYFRSGR